MRSRAIAWMLVGIVGSTLGLSGCNFLRGYAEGPSTSFAPYRSGALPASERGAARLLFDDFGSINTDTLETNAVPWKLVAAALVSTKYRGEPPTQEHLREILKSFGFIYPQSVGNWPGAKQPEFVLPLGIISGNLQRDIPRVRAEVANLSCASCHGGVTYDAVGNPQPVVWLGLPNTSLDLDAYVDGVLDALRAAVKDREATFAAIQALFPEVSADELKSLRKFVWPRLVERLAQGTNGLPFRNGGPGRSNGVEALKFQFGLPAGAHPTASAVSMPYIGEQRLRWSLLADGIYKRHGDPRFGPRALAAAATPEQTAEMVSFVTVPTLGLKPEQGGEDRQDDERCARVHGRVRTAEISGPHRSGGGEPRRRAVCALRQLSWRIRGARWTTAPEQLSQPAFDDRGDRHGRGAARCCDSGRVAAVAATHPRADIIEAAETRGYVAPALVGVGRPLPICTTVRCQRSRR